MQCESSQKTFFTVTVDEEIEFRVACSYTGSGNVDKQIGLKRGESVADFLIRRAESSGNLTLEDFGNECGIPVSSSVVATETTKSISVSSQGSTQYCESHASGTLIAKDDDSFWEWKLRKAERISVVQNQLLDLEQKHPIMPSRSRSRGRKKKSANDARSVSRSRKKSADDARSVSRSRKKAEMETVDGKKQMSGSDDTPRTIRTRSRSRGRKKEDECPNILKKNQNQKVKQNEKMNPYRFDVAGNALTGRNSPLINKYMEQSHLTISKIRTPDRGKKSPIQKETVQGRTRSESMSVERDLRSSLENKGRGRRMERRCQNTVTNISPISKKYSPTVDSNLVSVVELEDISGLLESESGTKSRSISLSRFTSASQPTIKEHIMKRGSRSLSRDRKKKAKELFPPIIDRSPTEKQHVKSFRQSRTVTKYSDSAASKYKYPYRTKYSEKRNWESSDSKLTDKKNEPVHSDMIVDVNLSEDESEDEEEVKIPTFICRCCCGEFPSRFELHTHLVEFHRITNSSAVLPPSPVPDESHVDKVKKSILKKVHLERKSVCFEDSQSENSDMDNINSDYRKPDSSKNEIFAEFSIQRKQKNTIKFDLSKQFVEEISLSDVSSKEIIESKSDNGPSERNMLMAMTANSHQESDKHSMDTIETRNKSSMNRACSGQKKNFIVYPIKDLPVDNNNKCRVRTRTNRKRSVSSSDHESDYSDQNPIKVLYSDNDSERNSNNEPNSIFDAVNIVSDKETRKSHTKSSSKKEQKKPDESGFELVKDPEVLNLRDLQDETVHDTTRQIYSCMDKEEPEVSFVEALRKSSCRDNTQLLSAEPQSTSALYSHISDRSNAERNGEDKELPGSVENTSNVCKGFKLKGLSVSVKRCDQNDSLKKVRKNNKYTPKKSNYDKTEEKGKNTLERMDGVVKPTIEVSPRIEDLESITEDRNMMQNFSSNRETVSPVSLEKKKVNCGKGDSKLSGTSFSNRTEVNDTVDSHTNCQKFKKAESAVNLNNRHIEAGVGKSVEELNDNNIVTDRQIVKKQDENAILSSLNSKQRSDCIISHQKQNIQETNSNQGPEIISEKEFVAVLYSKKDFGDCESHTSCSDFDTSKELESTFGQTNANEKVSVESTTNKLLIQPQNSYSETVLLENKISAERVDNENDDLLEFMKQEGIHIITEEPENHGFSMLNVDISTEELLARLAESYNEDVRNDNCKVNETLGKVQEKNNNTVQPYSGTDNGGEDIICNNPVQSGPKDKDSVDPGKEKNELKNITSEAKEQPKKGRKRSKEGNIYLNKIEKKELEFFDNDLNIKQSRMTVDAHEIEKSAIMGYSKEQDVKIKDTTSSDVRTSDNSQSDKSASIIETIESVIKRIQSENSCLERALNSDFEEICNEKGDAFSSEIKAKQNIKIKLKRKRTWVQSANNIDDKIESFDYARKEKNGRGSVKRRRKEQNQTTKETDGGVETNGNEIEKTGFAESLKNEGTDDQSVNQIANKVANHLYTTADARKHNRMKSKNETGKKHICLSSSADVSVDFVTQYEADSIDRENNMINKQVSKCKENKNRKKKNERNSRKEENFEVGAHEETISALESNNSTAANQPKIKTIDAHESDTEEKSCGKVVSEHQQKENKMTEEIAQRNEDRSVEACLQKANHDFLYVDTAEAVDQLAEDDEMSSNAMKTSSEEIPASKHVSRHRKKKMNTEPTNQNNDINETSMSYAQYGAKQSPNTASESNLEALLGKHSNISGKVPVIKLQRIGFKKIDINGLHLKFKGTKMKPYWKIKRKELDDLKDTCSIIEGNSKESLDLSSHNEQKLSRSHENQLSDKETLKTTFSDAKEHKSSIEFGNGMEFNEVRAEKVFNVSSHDNLSLRNESSKEGIEGRHDRQVKTHSESILCSESDCLQTPDQLNKEIKNKQTEQKETYEENKKEKLKHKKKHLDKKDKKKDGKLKVKIIGKKERLKNDAKLTEFEKAMLNSGKVRKEKQRLTKRSISVKQKSAVDVESIPESNRDILLGKSDIHKPVRQDSVSLLAKSKIAQNILNKTEKERKSTEEEIPDFPPITDLNLLTYLPLSSSSTTTVTDSINLTQNDTSKSFRPLKDLMKTLESVGSVRDMITKNPKSTLLKDILSDDALNNIKSPFQITNSLSFCNSPLISNKISTLTGEAETLTSSGRPENSDNVLEGQNLNLEAVSRLKQPKFVTGSAFNSPKSFQSGFLSPVSGDFTFSKLPDKPVLFSSTPVSNSSPSRKRSCHFMASPSSIEGPLKKRLTDGREVCRDDSGAEEISRFLFSDNPDMMPDQKECGSVKRESILKSSAPRKLKLKRFPVTCEVNTLNEGASEMNTKDNRLSLNELNKNRTEALTESASDLDINALEASVLETPSKTMKTISGNGTSNSITLDYEDTIEQSINDISGNLENDTSGVASEILTSLSSTRTYATVDETGFQTDGNTDDLLSTAIHEQWNTPKTRHKTDVSHLEVTEDNEETIENLFTKEQENVVSDKDLTTVINRSDNNVKNKDVCDGVGYDKSEDRTDEHDNAESIKAKLTSATDESEGLIMDKVNNNVSYTNDKDGDIGDEKHETEDTMTESASQATESDSDSSDSCSSESDTEADEPEEKDDVLSLYASDDASFLEDESDDDCIVKMGVKEKPLSRETIPGAAVDDDNQTGSASKSEGSEGSGSVDMEIESTSSHTTETLIEVNTAHLNQKLVMREMVPPGYCHYFHTTGKCKNGTGCRFKHDQPTKETLVKHWRLKMEQFLRQGELDRSLKLFEEVAKDDIVPPHLVKHMFEQCRVAGNVNCFPIIKYMFDKQFLTVGVIDQYIYMCGNNPVQCINYLWEIFQRMVNLNIQPANDAMCILLRAFCESKCWDWLWQVMLYCNEMENFNMPIFCQEQALRAMLKEPGRYFNYAVQFLLSSSVERVQRVDKQLLQDVYQLAQNSNQRRLAEGIMKALTSSRLTPRPWTPVTPFLDGPQEEAEEFFEDEETVREWMNKFHGLQYSRNWDYLGELFLKRSTIHCPIPDVYINKMIDIVKKNEKAVEIFAEFLACIFRRYETEAAENELVKMDRKGLAAIGNSLLLQFAEKQNWAAGYHILCHMVTFNIDYLKDCGVSQVPLIAMETCLHCTQPDAALQILKETSTSSLESSLFSFIHGLVPSLLQQLISQLKFHDGVCVLTRVFSVVFRESNQPDPNILKTVQQCTCQILSTFLAQGDVPVAIKTFQLWKEYNCPFIIDILVSRSLLVACISYKYENVTRDVFEMMKRGNVYPLQRITKPRSMVLTLWMTSPEMYLVIEDYLKWLYNDLCNSVLENVKLSQSDLQLTIRFTGQLAPADEKAPFLHGVPGSPANAQKMAADILSQMAPGISCILQTNGTLTLEPLSLERWLCETDKKSRRQGLRFSQPPMSRTGITGSNRGRGRGFPRPPRHQISR